MHEKRFHGGPERLRSPERLARLEVPRVVELFWKDREAQSILDIGTGTGVFAEALARPGVRVTGVDVSDEMLNHARALVPQANFVHGALESLPSPDRAFDVAFLGLVLHETEHLGQALSEVRRVTRQGAVVLEWPETPGDMGPPAEHRLTRTQIEEAARQAGFAAVRVESLTDLVLYWLISP